MNPRESSGLLGWSSLKFDLPSSIAVFLVALPLCMGIAIASGVPVAAGLITGIVGGIVVGILAGAPLQVSGPAAGLTVIVFEIVRQQGLGALGIVVLGAGIFQIAAGMLKMGQWFRAVSPAVIHGMLAGIGVLIFASQFHVMVDDKPKENGIRNLITIPQAIAKGLPLPGPSTQEERVVRTELLKEASLLHTEQVQLRDAINAAAIAAAHNDATSPTLLSSEFAERQAAITENLRQLAARVSNEGKAFTHHERAEKAALDAIAQSDAALAKIKSSAPEADTPAQQAAVAGLEKLVGQLKNHQWAAKIGIITICVLVMWQMLAPKRLKVLPGPLLAVVIASGIAFAWSLPVLYVQVPDSLLSAIRLPSMSMLSPEGIGGIIGSALIVALIASAETLLCATAIDKMHDGPRTNYDRELLAQGVGNTICGLLGALPMTGVIVRSAANVQAGARTRKSAFLHGVWLLLFVAVLTPVIRIIPVAGLAAVLVYTGYKLVNIKHIKELRKYGWSEVGVYLATMITIVTTDLLTGVVVGIGLSAAKLLYTFSHLETHMHHDTAKRRCTLTLSGTATFLRLPTLASALERVPGHAELHVDLEKLHYIDHACLDLLESWAEQHKTTGGTLVLDWRCLPSPAPENKAPLLKKVLVA